MPGGAGMIMDQRLMFAVACSFMLLAMLPTSIGAAEDREILPVVQVAPQYPMKAVRDCLGGTVIVEFTVTVEGTVADAKILRSVHDGLFDKAALEAIRQWRFKPRIVDGKPVERRAELPLKFEKADCCKD